MRTIDEYLDAAVINLKLRSDRALSVQLGLSPGSVNHFRMKKAWPSDATMIKIATLADEDPEEALLNLNIWRNTDSAAGSMYSRLLDKLKFAAMLCIAMAFITAGIVALPGYETADVPARKGRNHIAGRLLFGIAAIHAVGAFLSLWASARKERIRAELVFF